MVSQHVRRAIWSTVMALCLATAPAGAAQTRCTLRYDLAGWSVFYKTASGSGVIECDDGASARVRITSRGGGLTVGRSQITDGRGRFSPVASINDLFGNYASAGAHAGLGRSASAQVLTRGQVSLELTGTGSGVDLGFDFGRFSISPAH